VSFSIPLITIFLFPGKATLRPVVKIRSLPSVIAGGKQACFLLKAVTQLKVLPGLALRVELSVNWYRPRKLRSG
jgi:hypothetical protein